MRYHSVAIGLLLTVCLDCHHASGNDVVMATVRIFHPESSATGFLLTPESPTAERAGQLILVTAGHVFDKITSDEVTVDFRRKADDGLFLKVPIQVKIRADKTPLWIRHSQYDVAALWIAPPPELALCALTVDQLASSIQLQDVEPGDLVRCVVFPHAAVFEPSKAGLPLVRLGCVATAPLLRPDHPATFLVDYNTFEGDSGGPVYQLIQSDASGRSRLQILGLVHGQHFLNQRYQLTYTTGEFRKQLGLAIVVDSQAIRETVEALQAK